MLAGRPYPPIAMGGALSGGGNSPHDTLNCGKDLSRSRCYGSTRVHCGLCDGRRDGRPGSSGGRGRQAGKPAPETEDAPWHPARADHRGNARLLQAARRGGRLRLAAGAAGAELLDAGRPGANPRPLHCPRHRPGNGGLAAAVVGKHRSREVLGDPPRAMPSAARHRAHPADDRRLPPGRASRR